MIVLLRNTELPTTGNYLIIIKDWPILRQVSRMKPTIFIILILLLFLSGCRVSGVSVGAMRIETPYGDSYAPIGLVNIELGEK